MIEAALNGLVKKCLVLGVELYHVAINMGVEINVA